MPRAKGSTSRKAATTAATGSLSSETEEVTKHSALLAETHEARENEEEEREDKEDGKEKEEEDGEAAGHGRVRSQRDRDFDFELGMVVGAEDDQGTTMKKKRRRMTGKDKDKEEKEQKGEEEQEEQGEDTVQEKGKEAADGEGRPAWIWKFLEANAGNDEDEDEDEEEQGEEEREEQEDQAGPAAGTAPTDEGAGAKFFDGQLQRKLAHSGGGGGGSSSSSKTQVRSTPAESAGEGFGGLPPLPQEDLLKALRNLPVTHKAQCDRLNAWHHGQFFQWYFELQSGFNLLFYGYGSKKSLLMKFAEELLADHHQLVVNGYFPGLTPKTILTTICESILGHKGGYRDMGEQCAYISHYFSNPKRVVQDLYLIVHNIDGASLRSERAQQVLSHLASVPRVHLLASIDHINAPLIWDSSKVSKLNWIFHDVTTYEHYSVETSFETNFLHTQTSGNTRGASFVLKSLPAKARSVFKILVEFQLKEGGPGSLGMSWKVLFTRCREAFLVTSDQALRQQLTEFRDHELILTRKGADKVEYFYSPLDRQALKNLLENDLAQ